jgi:hypothetical protein
MSSENNFRMENSIKKKQINFRSTTKSFWPKSNILRVNFNSWMERKAYIVKEPKRQQEGKE